MATMRSLTKRMSSFNKCGLAYRLTTSTILSSLVITWVLIGNLAHLPSAAKSMTKFLPLFGLKLFKLFMRGIKNFSFLFSKSPIRFCPENPIRISRRAKRGGFLWLAISEMVPSRGIEPLSYP